MRWFLVASTWSSLLRNKKNNMVPEESVLSSTRLDTTRLGRVASASVVSRPQKKTGYEAAPFRMPWIMAADDDDERLRSRTIHSDPIYNIHYTNTYYNIFQIRFIFLVDLQLLTKSYQCRQYKQKTLANFRMNSRLTTARHFVLGLNTFLRNS